MLALVEGFAPDAVALARYLAGRGNDVRLAGRGTAPAEALSLADHGVRVDSDVDLDDEPRSNAPHRAYLDVWTPEVAPRVARLRAAGTRISCLSDLLTEEASMPTIGVTGTAGKTTTAAFVTHLLRASGIEAHASTTARLGNLWATEELLDTLPPDGGTGILVLELTSSHLAFCASSPTVAVVTSFWPDHLELHGSLAAYRRAKETIVAHQTEDDHVVLAVDDPDVASFAELTPARCWQVSAKQAVDHGVGVHDGEIVAFAPGGQARIAQLPALDEPRTRALLVATAAALAVGATPEAIRDAIPLLPAPAHRATIVGRRGATVLVDDGMATTPAKAAATLRSFPDSSVVWVAGGAIEGAGLAVHDTPEERTIMTLSIAAAVRASRRIVVFGQAAGRLSDEVEALGAFAEVTGTLDEAVHRALVLAEGAAAVVVSPMFPLSVDDRTRTEGLLTGRE